MKIITNDAVYVQKNDIGFLSESDLSIPYSIFMKVFGNGITIIDDRNGFQFVKFDAEGEIDFFKKLDWIIDYNSIKDLSEKEIKTLIKKVFKEKRKIVCTFKAMNDNERRLNPQLVDEWYFLEHKYISLKDILNFKKGHINMLLPEGVSYPKISDNEDKGLKKLLKKL